MRVGVSLRAKCARHRRVDTAVLCFLRSQCTDSNPIVFCDGCDIGVHKCCYGIRDIPEGDWLCRKCSTKGGHRGGPV